MMNNFIRKSSVAAAILTFLRVYLGYQWFTGGWGKLTGGGFDATGFIQGAINSAGGDHPALPNAGLFSFMVMWGEILVGAALILGIFTNFAALMAITMNFAFLFSGTVSTNAQMVLLTVFIIAAGYNAGRFGLDRWVVPFLKNHKPRRNKKEKKELVVA